MFINYIETFIATNKLLQTGEGVERQTKKGRLCVGPPDKINKTGRGQNQEVIKRGRKEERQANLHDPCQRSHQIKEIYQQNLRQ